MVGGFFTGSFRLRVSYMEIDNDDVRDLLSDCGGGFAGQQAANGKSGQPEFGLAEIECDCVSDVLSCLASGKDTVESVASNL